MFVSGVRKTSSFSYYPQFIEITTTNCISQTRRLCPLRETQTGFLQAVELHRAPLLVLEFLASGFNKKDGKMMKTMIVKQMKTKMSMMRQMKMRKMKNIEDEN